MSPNEKAVRAGFLGIQLPPMPYTWWERGFVERFGGVLPINNSAPAKTYLSKRGIIWDHDPIPFEVAARAYHTNSYRWHRDEQARMFAWFQDYEAQFDRVPPEIVEDDLTEEDWRKTEQYMESFDPKNPARRGRKNFV